MPTRKSGPRRREAFYHLAGWILFILCALFFIASSLKNHDTLALIGSVIFLAACIFFVVPLIRPGREAGGDHKKVDEE